MEMQENSWPLEWIRNGTFEKTDMCFEMTDVGETILQWCQGTVIELVKDKETLKYMDLKSYVMRKNNGTVLQQIIAFRS